MGYTIYWKYRGENQTDEWFEKIQNAVQNKYDEELSKINAPSGCDLLDILHRDDEDEMDDFFHEWFGGEMMTKSNFEFCKTARKAYDSAVKAALIEAQRLSGNAWNISCDDGKTYRFEGE